MTCPEYLVPWHGQLGQGSTGAFDCTAWAASRVIGASTCGAKVPSGRTIRLLSDEPKPDPASPGLNLVQVADVSGQHYGVALAVHIGARALDWDEYDDLRESGRAMIIQLSYAPIAHSMFDAGRGFKGGHAMAETQHATYDSLADGRAGGVWRFDGRLYPRNLMKEAAGDLIIAQDTHGNAIRVGHGKVWCAIGRDTAPDYRVSIQPAAGKKVRHYRDFRIAGGKIVKPASGKPYRVRETRGFTAPSSVPRGFKHPDGRYRFLVEVEGGPRKGQFVAEHWAKEKP